MLMKHLLFTLLLALLSQLIIPCKSFAQDIPDDEDEDVIVIDITSNTTEIGPKRSLSIVPIIASYRVSISSFEVFFLYSIGEVIVRTFNVNTGEYYSFTVASCAGTMSIPLLLSSGLWEISFCAEDGSIYEGILLIP